MVVPFLVACDAEEPAVEKPHHPKKHALKDADPAYENMLAPPSNTLGEGARKYLPASRFNEGTQLTSADYTAAAEESIRCKDDYTAMTLADEAVRLDPQSGLAYYARGRARFGALSGDDQAVIDDFKSAIKYHAGNSGAWHYLARAYDANKDVPHAIEAIGEAIKIRPNDEACFKTRAALYGAIGEKEKAKADYLSAVKIRPEDAEAFFLLGQVEEKSHHEEEALRYYETSVKAGKPGEHMAYKIMSFKRLGELYRRMGKFQKALETYSSALAFDKSDEELYRLRGQIYADLNMHERAVVDFSKAIRMAPEYSRQTYEARSLSYEKLGRKELAEKDRQGDIVSQFFRFRI